tara:strand:- start:5009 stop:6451 length:1443 start_codon:yes stop_codon:yes gene_type:complete
MGLLNQTQAAYYSANNAANYGNYQFTTLDNIISGFMVAYVGEHKILNKINRTDVQFHAMRAIQELSYDVFRSIKSQEIEVPNTLSMILPQDYVNYVKLTTVGSDGIEKNIYPTGKTSNPFAITQNTNGDYTLQSSRKLTITVPTGGTVVGSAAGTTVTDGDYIKLLMNPTEAPSMFDPIDTLNPGASPSINELYPCFMYIIFDTDDDVTDGFGFTDAAQLTGPKFHISLQGQFTQTAIANKIAGVINQYGKHIATVVNGSVEIEYKNSLNWPEALINSGVAALGPQTTGTEAVYSIGGFAGSPVATGWAITINNTGLAGASGDDLLEQVPSNTWGNYQSTNNINQTTDATDSTDAEVDHRGRRYGLDPQHAHQHGSFYIDYSRGLINFSSNLSGETIILDYISDGLGTDAEMVVHKFCEEAIYKWIIFGVLSARANVPEYMIARFKKEKFAETRKAKIRLSNIKIEEFTQVLKGMGKLIK